MAAFLSLLVSGTIFYLLVAKPLMGWVGNQGHRKLAASARESGQQVHQKAKGIKLSNAVVFRVAAAVVVAMLVYMPANELMGSVQSGFEYRFIWDMGTYGYVTYTPNALVLVAQVLVVSVVAGLLVASNRLGK